MKKARSSSGKSGATAGSQVVRIVPGSTRTRKCSSRLMPITPSGGSSLTSASSSGLPATYLAKSIEPMRIGPTLPAGVPRCSMKMRSTNVS